MTFHDHLARAWANYHNQTGTPKQVAKIQRQLTEPDLVRMLAERGVKVVTEPDGHVVVSYGPRQPRERRERHTCDIPGYEQTRCKACV